MVGSPPPCLDATMISRLSLLHSLPRLASTAPLTRLIFAQCEWPDMLPPLTPAWMGRSLILRRRPVARKTGLEDSHAYSPDGHVLSAGRRSPGRFGAAAGIAGRPA